MDVQIRITGGDQVEEFAALWAWLHDEDELDARMKLVDHPARDTDLGDVFEMLSIVLGSGGAGAVLSRSLSTWLRTRRSHVKVSVSSPERVVVLDATNVADALPLLQEMLRTTDES